MEHRRTAPWQGGAVRCSSPVLGSTLRRLSCVLISTRISRGGRFSDGMRTPRFCCFKNPSEEWARPCTGIFSFCLSSGVGPHTTVFEMWRGHGLFEGFICLLRRRPIGNAPVVTLVTSGWTRRCRLVVCCCSRSSVPLLACESSHRFSPTIICFWPLRGYLKSPHEINNCIRQNAKRFLDPPRGHSFRCWADRSGLFLTGSSVHVTAPVTHGEESGWCGVMAHYRWGARLGESLKPGCPNGHRTGRIPMTAGFRRRRSLALRHR